MGLHIVREYRSGEKLPKNRKVVTSYRIELWEIGLMRCVRSIKKAHKIGRKMLGLSVANKEDLIIGEYQK